MPDKNKAGMVSAAELIQDLEVGKQELLKIIEMLTTFYRPPFMRDPNKDNKAVIITPNSDAMRVWIRIRQELENLGIL